MADQDKMLDKIRKLLAKAEDPAVTPEEADSYNELAAGLIARYGIDQALLAESGQVTDVITSVRIRVHNPYSRDKAGLLNAIAQALRCRVILHSCGKTVETVTVFGYRCDLDRVELLFTSLLVQAATGLARVRPDGWRRESVAAYRRTWLAGFGTAVYRRLTAAEQRATTQADQTPSGTVSTSTALVLVDRKARVDTAFSTEFAHVRKSARRQLSGSGYHEGHRAGQNADLGSPRLAEQRRAIGGRAS